MIIAVLCSTWICLYFADILYCTMVYLASFWPPWERCEHHFKSSHDVLWCVPTTAIFSSNFTHKAMEGRLGPFHREKTELEYSLPTVSWCSSILYTVLSLVPRPPPFLPSDCIHNNTWEQKTILIFVDLPIPCIIVNTNGRSKRGRPRTEATQCWPSNGLYWMFFNFHRMQLIKWIKYSNVFLTWWSQPKCF